MDRQRNHDESACGEESHLQAGLVDARMDTRDILETVHTSRLGHRPRMHQDRIFNVLQEAGTSGSEVAMDLWIVVNLKVTDVTGLPHALRLSQRQGLRHGRR